MADESDRFAYFPGRRVRCLVTGVSGFIGGHLGAELRRQGHAVLGVDWTFPEPDGVPLDESCDEFLLLDLRTPEACAAALARAGAPAALGGAPEEVHVFHLAADMGGMGFIQSNHAACLLNNALADLNVLEAARRAGAARFFYASSACAYPEYRQAAPGAKGLREADAWPAQPQDAYGLEKLFAEEACAHYARDFGMAVRVARFHNVYGPRGTWRGGREKAPAALCRKVAAAEDGDDLEIWGDGAQTRSFVFVDDLVDGVLRLTACDAREVCHGAPLNLGTEHAVSVDELARLIAGLAGKPGVRLRHDPAGPQGVRGRNSDNDLMRRVLGWEPPTPLADGMAALYGWVADRVAALGPEERADAARSVVAPTAAPPPL